MPGRTFVIGDIHGDVAHLWRLLASFPELTSRDTLVFLGDYLDRGPRSAEVIDYVRKLPRMTPAQVVALRGNHEDAWLRVVKEGWDEFVLPPLNGCLAAYRSFVGGPIPQVGEEPLPHELMMIQTGSFLPDDVVRWMEGLPYWFEDEQGIYVHSGLPRDGDRFMHPSEVKAPISLLWCRDEAFFRDYDGKRVFFGHTLTDYLWQELSAVPDPGVTRIWTGKSAIGLDTGCGHGGFLSAIELPSTNIYDSV
jgi:serine/threonine protein phosphatase 1